MRETVAWAEKKARVPWAYTLSNAGAAYTQFRNGLESLSDIDWDAMDSTDFRDPDVKEGKQAEFLVDGSSRGTSSSSWACIQPLW